MEKIAIQGTIRTPDIVKSRLNGWVAECGDKSIQTGSRYSGENGQTYIKVQNCKNELFYSLADCCNIVDNGFKGFLSLKENGSILFISRDFFLVLRAINDSGLISYDEKTGVGYFIVNGDKKSFQIKFLNADGIHFY